MPLAADERRRLERLAVRLDRRVGAGFSGAHRSIQRGRSLDVADWREYRPGDDVRTIDVQAWARLDQVVVRLYEADVDVAAHVLIDTSASMEIGAKLAQAQRIAAAIGVVLLNRNETMTLMTLDGGRPQRFLARSAVVRYLDALEALRAAGPTPMFARAKALVSLRPRRGVMVVISDFLTDEWSDAITRLGARGDTVVAVCISAAADDQPDAAGEVQFLDVETGERVNVDATADVVEAFAARRRERRRAVAAAVRRRGGVMIELDATDDLFSVVVPALLRVGLVS